MSQTEVTNARAKALEMGRHAEGAMLDEYHVWRRSWEKNPTLDALKGGILAIRALTAEVEALSQETP